MYREHAFFMKAFTRNWFLWEIYLCRSFAVYKISKPKGLNRHVHTATHYPPLKHQILLTFGVILCFVVIFNIPIMWCFSAFSLIFHLFFGLDQSCVPIRRFNFYLWKSVLKIFCLLVREGGKNLRLI